MELVLVVGLEVFVLQKTDFIHSYSLATPEDLEIPFDDLYFAEMVAEVADWPEPLLYFAL